MKRLLTVLISCSLALAATGLAQQEEASPEPEKKQGKGQQRQEARQEARQERKEARKEARQDAPQEARQEARQAKEKGAADKAMENRKAMRKQKAEGNASASEANASASESATAETKTPAKNEKAQAGRRGKQKEQATANQETTADQSATTDEARSATSTKAKTKTDASAAAQAPVKKANAKKPDPKVVEKVKSEYANFKAQPKPQKVPTVTFNKNYTISGANQWQGPQYEVYRTYRPTYHDQSYYQSHYSRVEIIAGGAYYFNNGYWYPAWGYNPSYQYYAYDAPIYVGKQALPPDRVIANVQAILKAEGYYRGEVDGLLGPLTREALIGYQTDHGLYATAVIDEPTLQSLNLG
ncbi:hypothetical protein BH20VER3_BH20VER3_06720 [soil metagenome]